MNNLHMVIEWVAKSAPSFFQFLHILHILDCITLTFVLKETHVCIKNSTYSKFEQFQVKIGKKLLLFFWKRNYNTMSEHWKIPLILIKPYWYVTLRSVGSMCKSKYRFSSVCHSFYYLSQEQSMYIKWSSPSSIPQSGCGAWSDWTYVLR